jgi:uroporphyrinogen-III synthase
MKVVLTRPDPDNDALSGALSTHGIACLVAPMLTIEATEAAALGEALAEAQAILATSANGVRALAAATEGRDLPLIAVGDATADAARQAGFAQVPSADGDSAALAVLAEAELDPKAGPLVHVAGRHVAGDLDTILAAAGFDYRRIEVYDAVATTTLPSALSEALRGASVDSVAFFSPRTAATFTALVREDSLAESLRGVTAYCLSDAVAAATEANLWQRVLVAPRPRVDALIDQIIADHTAPNFAPNFAPNLTESVSESAAARRWRPWMTNAAISALVALVVVFLLATSLTLNPGPEVPADLERRLQALSDQSSQLAATRESLAALDSRLADFDARIAVIESEVANRPPADGIDRVAIETLAQELAATRAALRDEMAELEVAFGAALADAQTGATPVAVAETTAHDAGLLLAVGQLRTAAAGNLPFSAELAAIATLGDGDNEIAPLVAAMEPLAETGVATALALKLQFGAAAPAILRALDAPADAGWLSQAFAEIKSLVSVRRVGGDISGDDPEAVLARAEAQLAHGDVAAAMALVDGLDLEDTVAPAWRGAAANRAAVETGVAGLTEIALRRASGVAPRR